MSLSQSLYLFQIYSTNKGARWSCWETLTSTLFGYETYYDFIIKFVEVWLFVASNKYFLQKSHKTTRKTKLELGRCAGLLWCSIQNNFCMRSSWSQKVLICPITQNSWRVFLSGWLGFFVWLVLVLVLVLLWHINTHLWIFFFFHFPKIQSVPDMSVHSAIAKWSVPSSTHGIPK